MLCFKDRKKDFFLRYQDPEKKGTKRLKLGTYPDMSYATAREKAIEAFNQIRPDKGGETHTWKFETLAELYMDKYAKLTNRDWKRKQQHLDNVILPKIGKMTVSSIQSKHIASIIMEKEATAPGSAPKIKSLISHIFSWGIANMGLRHNPAEFVSTIHRPKPVERVLSDFELYVLLKTLPKIKSKLFKAYYELVLYTGQRRGVCLIMRKKEINKPVEEQGWWEIPIENTKKQKSLHMV